MIKTRFAPSPTGYLHIGGLRTALYSYLFAKQNKGIFALRIEDTDQKRFVEGAVESLQNALHFFDLNWDEGPIFQSKRTEIYAKYAKELVENGHAYPCFCTSERLDEMRKAQEAQKLPPKYDGLCTHLSLSERQARIEAGEAHVIRQRIPQEDLFFNDLVRGDLQFHGKDIDDQVLIKSDGFPTYHLANVVDDHEMEITHVIRGEEWLPSTPKHLWLYKAFGWKAPEFAHLPLLLNPDRSKLSKRQGDVAAEDYIKKGYLKEAIVNFIAFLGWNPGTEEELFTLEQLVERFSLDRVQKAGAVFNLEKLDWLNGHYIRQKSLPELEVLILPYLKDEPWFKGELKPEILASVQLRMKTLSEAPALLKPLLLEEFDYDLGLFLNEKMKVDKATAVLALENSIPALENLADGADEEAIKACLMEVIEKLGLKNGQVLWPLRIALSNEQYSPGVFELVKLLGKELSIKRVKRALDKIR
ncbi:MAG: glutamate--tRNA ligase [Candidatus Gracilibacteria bacterium]|jgi:glutamyl-tRNA synthetase